MATIGFIGLGNMGAPMAANLAEKMTVALGAGAPSKEAVEALRTIERLRAGILGNHDGTE